jgi:hypothetical protein
MQDQKTQKNVATFNCEVCDYTTSVKSNLTKHYKTDKHLSNILSIGKVSKVSTLFHCKHCAFSTHNKTNYKKHLETVKCKSVTILQKNAKNAKENSTLDPNTNNQNNNEHYRDWECQCGKTFADRTGLWRHKKICKNNAMDTTKLVEIVVEVMKNKTFMMEHGLTINNIDNSITTNSHNKSFNLNFFLNETCKDAYNMSEFVEQLDVTMDDMLNTSRVGYAKGVSEIVVKGLKALDIGKRPIHCTDSKRETLYIKENDKWSREPDDRPVLLGAIKKIAGKNINNIFEWQKQHTDYRDPQSRNNDLYLKMIVNVMQGGTDEEINASFCTVFRNVAHGAIIPKHN